MVRTVMQAAEAHGCHAYGFALTSDSHDGGHVWLLFDQPHAQRDLHALMRDILSAAGVAGAEVYPSAADLRLPFGVHRRCGRRGDLLINSGATPMPIDDDPLAVLAFFVAHVQHTDSALVAQARSRQDARQLQIDAQLAAARAALPRMSIGGQPTGMERIQHYNATTDLVRLLEQYGAKTAYRAANGTILMHCAANQDHRNGDAHPSLIVQPGTGRQTGKLICGCHTPTCRLHNHPGQVKDPFEVYCIMEGIDHRDGVKRLSRTAPTTSTRGIGNGGASRNRRFFSMPPASVPAPASHRDEMPAANRVAALPAAGISQPASATAQFPAPAAVDHPGLLWRSAAQSRFEELRASAARPTDKQLYAFYLERCHTQPACRPSNAAAAAALGVCTRTIMLTKRRLCHLGYIAITRSQDGKNTSMVDLILPVMLPTEGGVIGDAPVAEGGVIGAVCGAGGGDREAQFQGGGVIKRSPESKLRIVITKKGGGILPRSPLPPIPRPPQPVQNHQPPLILNLSHRSRVPPCVSSSTRPVRPMR
jgi:hypothetical protein